MKENLGGKKKSSQFGDTEGESSRWAGSRRPGDQRTGVLSDGSSAALQKFCCPFSVLLRKAGWHGVRLTSNESAT